MFLNINKIYGLDIGSSSVKITEYKDGNSNFWIKNYKREESGSVSQESIISALLEIIEENSLQNKKFILSIPRYHCIIRKIYSPFKDKNKISQTIIYEIETHIPYSITEIYFDFFISKIINNTSEIIVIVVNRDIINYYNKIIDACKIKVKSITSADIAEFNYISSKLNDKTGTTAFLNCGAKNISLTIMKDGEWDFSRSIQKGGDYLTELIASSKRISFNDAEKLKLQLDLNDDNNLESIYNKGLYEIANEIRYTFNSYLTDPNLNKINKIYITGGGAQIKNIEKQLSSYLDIHSECLLLDEKPNSINSYLFGAALGCAIQNRNNKNFININLLPINKSVEIKDTVQIYIFAVLITLTFFVIFLNMYIRVNIKEKKLNIINNEISKIFKETLPDVKVIVNEKQQMINIIDKENKKLDIYSGLNFNEKLYPLNILKELSTIINKKINLELQELNITGSMIVIGGKTQSFRDVDLIKEKLKESDYFKNITVDSLKTSNDGKIEFKILIKI